MNSPKLYIHILTKLIEKNGWDKPNALDWDEGLNLDDGEKVDPLLVTDLTQKVVCHQLLLEEASTALRRAYRTNISFNLRRISFLRLTEHILGLVVAPIGECNKSSKMRMRRHDWMKKSIKCYISQGPLKIGLNSIANFELLPTATL